MARSLLLLLPLFAWLTAAAQPTLDNILAPSRLPYLKNSTLIQISSNDTTGGNNDCITIPAGGTARIAEITGPAVITHLWCTISSRDKHFLRRILLRMYWDGEKQPSVEVPIGDFFGTGFQYKQFITPIIGMSSGGYYSYWAMPFNFSARVEIVNETGEEIQSFYYHIDYQKLSEPLDPSIAYFHASWHRDVRTPPGQPYTILEAEGEGHVVGVAMSMQGYDNGLQFLEGDEAVYVDGERQASMRGTGTEDYFNSGWYFPQGEFAAPYHGLILKDDSLSRIAAYRFHILDAIPFKRSIRFQIEHGHANEEIADYSSTVYWYQKEPHKPFGQMMKPALRIPLRVQIPNGALEVESLPLRGVKLPHEIQDMSSFGPDWGGLKQVRIAASKPGDTFTVSTWVEEARYDMDLYFTKGPDYGKVQVYSDGRRLAEIQGYDKTVLPGGMVRLKDLRSNKGELCLEFRVVGKDGKSTGYTVGLDAFTLTPRREFIPEWLLIGPFPNPTDAMQRRLGLDTPYPPETELDVRKSYRGVNDQEVRWRSVKTPAKGRVDLYDFEPNEHVVVYALTYVHSSTDQTVPLLLGSDDGVKVFFNGAVIHRVLPPLRISRPDQDRVPLALKKGWNTLLIKIENNLGGYNFYARVIDPARSVRFSLRTP